MCGIAGQLSQIDSRARFASLLPRLQAAIAHRGPDDRGIHVSADGHAGMVGTRLAILDLSPAGHQPMVSADGRHAIVFNGEIYNFRALAEMLEKEGVALTSHSDTEVVLHLYRAFGVDCVDKLRGMFAFALWDDREKSCFLARDPLGIKPLYYQLDAEGTLSFASELGALRRTGIAAGDLDPEALVAYFCAGSVPEPLTLLRSVRMLEAGHWLRWRDGKIESKQFWSLPIGTSEQGTALSATEDAEAVRGALMDSLQHHFVSDVPVGLFLSGGIDSTALLALSKALGHRALATYSLSFDDDQFNEGELARRTAEHFQSNHVDHRLSGDRAKELFTDFLRRMDQPSVDGFNTFCISWVARQYGAKVVLSGLGGDENFGGYPSFRRVPQLMNLGRVPAPLRRAAGVALQAWHREPRWRRLGEYLQRPPTLDTAMAAIRGIFTESEALSLVRHFVPGADSSHQQAHEETEPVPEHLADAISRHELSHYMRNQLLRDSDVASMAWGLELRVPLVDRDLLSTLARVPAARRLRPRKAMLMDAVPEIPSWVSEAPKRGFLLPFEQWLREDWRTLFAETARPRAGVSATTWYQRWCLFVLQHWLKN